MKITKTILAVVSFLTLPVAASTQLSSTEVEDEINATSFVPCFCKHRVDEIYSLFKYVEGREIHVGTYYPLAACQAAMASVSDCRN